MQMTKLNKYIVSAKPEPIEADDLEWEIHAENEEEAYDDGVGLAVEQGDSNFEYDIDVYEIEDD